MRMNINYFEQMAVGGWGRLTRALVVRMSSQTRESPSSVHHPLRLSCLHRRRVIACTSHKNENHKKNYLSFPLTAVKNEWKMKWKRKFDTQRTRAWIVYGSRMGGMKWKNYDICQIFYCSKFVHKFSFSRLSGLWMCGRRHTYKEGMRVDGMKYKGLKGW